MECNAHHEVPSVSEVQAMVGPRVGAMTPLEAAATNSTRPQRLSCLSVWSGRQQTKLLWCSGDGGDSERNKSNDEAESRVKCPAQRDKRQMLNAAAYLAGRARGFCGHSRNRRRF